MFTYSISDELKKKLQKIIKKDRILARNFSRKLKEVISRDEKTIHFYKNLKSPLNDYKRIHLTDNYVLLFEVIKNHIIFLEIKHRDEVYRK